MNRLYQALMVGAGGMARTWIREFLPAFETRCRIAALIDVDSTALAEQGDFIGLPESRRFGSIEKAFASFDRGDIGQIDACLIVIPPAVHRVAIDAAATRGIDILIEKPLASSWSDCISISRICRANRVRLAVVQNYRHQPAIEAARRLIAQDRVGKLNYVSARFARDYRRRNSWGRPFRHEIEHALLIEAASHHLDQIRNLSGANITFVAAEEWRPCFADGFDGECCALLIGRLAGGGRFAYDGNAVSASQQLSWTREQYRLECSEGAILVDGKNVCVYRHESGSVTGKPVPVPGELRRPHELMIGSFLDWLDGGTRPSSDLDDNLWTAAAMFAAIESRRRGCGVSVKDMVSDALKV
jgi:predicted dehydrogenase